MGVVGTDGVDLDVETVGRKELLVDVVPVRSGSRCRQGRTSRRVAHLPEELLAAPADVQRVVDVDVVVLCVEGLLDDGLVELDAVDRDVVVSLLDYELF